VRLDTLASVSPTPDVGTQHVEGGGVREWVDWLKASILLDSNPGAPGGGSQSHLNGEYENGGRG
jgi:hypothetical protein